MVGGAHPTPDNTTRNSAPGHQPSDIVDQPPVVRFTNMVIAEAIRLRASDIHIEPSGSHLTIRCRIDGIDRDKLNTRGGSLAVGHPFAATGARIVGALARMLEQRGSGRGLISVCTAGGMGVTAILER